MVTFSHLDPGTSELDWISSDRWPEDTVAPPADIGLLVIVAAHPDDETLGAGGLMARAHQLGIRSRVIIATDGESSHPHSPTHSSDDLRTIRRAEATEALRILTPDAEIDFVGISDGHVRDNRDVLSRHLVQAIEGQEPTRTLIVAPWRDDGHRDHNAAADAAAAVACEAGVRLWEYPIWMWHWASPDDARVPWAHMLRLPLTPGERAAKSSALGTHVSQTQPLSDAQGDEALLNREVQAHFDRSFEIFIQSSTAATGSPRSSLEQEFFDDFYEGKTDPWGFESRWYEERKRALTIASLPRPRFTSVLELGCSTGKLTRELAGRCDRLVAIDIAEAPLRVARERLKDFAGTTVLKMAAPQEWPGGSFDLIVLSEVGYYWNESDLHRALERIIGSLTSDGILVACHWRHNVSEYPLSGGEVHNELVRNDDLARIAQYEDKDFFLDVFSRPPGLSVAQETGLI